MARLIIPGFLSAFAAAAVFTPVTASAGPAGLTIPTAKNAMVQEAGWRRRQRTTVVDAPTTSVRTNDAPRSRPCVRVAKGPGFARRSSICSCRNRSPRRPHRTFSKGILETREIFLPRFSLALVMSPS